MAGGFLSGLQDLLLGHDYAEPGATTMGRTYTPAPPANLGGLPVADSTVQRQPLMGHDIPLTAAPVQKHEEGLLSKLGHYVTSPEGLLTIGTTLRAGGGNANAFQDQQRILNRWDERGDIAKAEQKEKDKASVISQAWKVGPDGKMHVDVGAMVDAMTKKGLPIDFQSIKAMSDLTNKDYTPVGSHVFGRDPLTGQGGWEPNAPPTEEELLDKESQRELRQAQVDYYKAQTVAKPQETQAKLITARRPVSGPRPPADITPAGRAALMAAMVKKGFKF